MSKAFGLELSEAEQERVARIRQEFVYWNLCDSTTRECGDETYLEQVKASNVTAINHTVCYTVDFAEGVKNVHWTRLYDARPDVGFIVKTYADIERACKERRTAIFMGFQDVTALEGDMNRMEVFYQPGHPLRAAHLPGPQPVRRRLRRAIPVRAQQAGHQVRREAG